MNIIFPIAGLGTRFSKEGYDVPKPFIKLKNVSIIEYAIRSLKLPGKYHIITRPLEKIYEKELIEIFERHSIDGQIHVIDRFTSGAAETCSLAREFVDSEESFVTVNCDQYTPWNPTEFIELTLQKNVDAIVTTFDHGDIVIDESSPYSFVKLDENGYATNFAEKFAISEHSLNGIHYWKKGSDFFDSAAKLLLDKSITQEKYISLSFNYLIKEHKKIVAYRMKPGEFYALGTPAEVKRNIAYL